jgi:hypothetical protein
LVAPAATVTEVGTVTPEIPEANAMLRPPVGAALLIVTVAVAVDGPVTALGLTASDVIVGAVTVSVPEAAVEPPAEALTDTLWLEPTATVVAVNEAVVAPAATVTEAGTVTAALPEVSVTLWPPVGAAVLRVTVPVDEVPPSTEVGLNVTVVARIGLTVRVADWLEPFEAAEMDGVACAVTGPVVMVTVPDVAPAAMVALVGPVTPLPVELNAIVRPPVGAGEEIVIVPVVLVPAKTVVGFKVNAVTVGPLTVRFAVADDEFEVPVIVAVVFVATAVVAIENVAVVAPAATFTLSTGVAAEELDVKATE